MASNNSKQLFAYLRFLNVLSSLDSPTTFFYHCSFFEVISKKAGRDGDLQAYLLRYAPHLLGNDDAYETFQQERKHQSNDHRKASVRWCLEVWRSAATQVLNRISSEQLADFSHCPHLLTRRIGTGVELPERIAPRLASFS